MVQNYIVDKLTLSDLKENGKVIIPNFQRGIVWTKAHRKEFIETVKSGDPFGVVLVSQSAPGEPYYLIDGLQRLSTLKAYMDKPLDFIDENNSWFTNQEKLNKLFSAAYSTRGLTLPNSSKLNKEQKAFVKKMINFMKAEKTTPEPTALWPKVAPLLSLDVNSFDVYKCFADFYKEFDESTKLPDIIIHAIVYQGPRDRLPYVFETLNTSSVSLTKYEVFSSQWPTIQIAINDEDLITKVWSKYDGLKKSSSFDVEVTQDNIRNNGMTLFEYCFGFSELVCDPTKPYSFLFNKGKKTTDPTGFELLALACGLQVNKADNLYMEDYLGGASGRLLISLKDALLEAIEVVSSALSLWVNDLNGSIIKNAGSYQVYYMIISVFNHLYRFDSKKKTLEKNDDDTWVAKFKKYAYKWYLYHILSGFWNSHRQVSDLHRLIHEPNDIDYGTNISDTTWKDTLTSYFDSNRDNCVTRNIASETRLFLNYLYQLYIIEDANRKKYFVKETDQGEELSFDIEHIVPVSKFDAFDEEFSMSTVGNLCYLPVKDNRSKRDHTIYEYALDRPSLTFNEQFLSLIDYPTREELAFIDCPIDQFKPKYKEFTIKREKKMVEKFIKLIV